MEKLPLPQFVNVRLPNGDIATQVTGPGGQVVNLNWSSLISRIAERVGMKPRRH